MKHCLVLLAGAFLAGCSVLPQSAPRLIQHDLGGSFAVPIGQRQVPLYALQVTSSPVVASLSMQYRKTQNPTARGEYAHNRWAASPASMVESALVRLLPYEDNGRCRLGVVLSEFLIEVQPDGSGAAVLSAELHLTGGVNRSRSAHAVQDVRIPLAHASPSLGAAALREATDTLAARTAAWINAQPAEVCRP